MSFGYGKRLGLKDEMQTELMRFHYHNFNKTQNIKISKAEGEHEFACVQLHNTLMGRGDIIKETTLEIFNTKDKKYWNSTPKFQKTILNLM